MSPEQIRLQLLHRIHLLLNVGLPVRVVAGLVTFYLLSILYIIGVLLQEVDILRLHQLHLLIAIWYHEGGLAVLVHRGTATR